MEKRKVKYTKKLHAYRLGVMLDNPNFCNCCPKFLQFNPDRITEWPWLNFASCCRVCQEFIGLKYKRHNCPCKVLGPEKAMKVSLKAIEDYYAS